MRLQLERLSSIGSVEAAAWNALAGDNPFLKHEFLAALEQSGCVGDGTTWQPCYLVARDDRGLAGALPLFIKYDSHGEFVFDWSWADAYERSGRSYYPKLVAAIPFTPATGQRLLLRDGLESGVANELLDEARNTAREIGASSLHVLFPTEPERQTFEGAGFLARKACQFHWANGGYRDFDEFLATFSADKRKKAKRERRRVAEADIVFEHLRGDEPSRADWDAIVDFYSKTFWRRGREPYLNRGFFERIAATMPANLVIVLARRHGVPIATAICFRSSTALYGRYWGSSADFHSLHFETCYYQGIDYCIREGLQRFEPGTQGEHKVARGFVPQPTWSCHWLRDPEFHRAVGAFLTRETRHVDAYMDEIGEHVPYRQASRDDALIDA
ncbi:MAG TPA: GNAT family N-acetyltransferase [Gammaproteobacteria bacterium]|nr:GNAT family N-acetyltransferase [Gammaproteobacteria bacterium]